MSEGSIFAMKPCGSGGPVRPCVRVRNQEEAFGTDAGWAAMALAAGRGVRADQWRNLLFMACCRLRGSSA
jgi:hypothetical protein